MSAHADAEFEAVHGFCRVDCEECDRLDREEIEAGLTPVEVIARATAMARAAGEREGYTKEEVDEAIASVVTAVIVEMGQP